MARGAAPSGGGDGAASPPATYSVALIESDARVRAQLMRSLKDVRFPTGFASLVALEERVDLRAPTVVILGPSFASENGLKEVRELTARYADVAVVMVVEDESFAILREAMRAGVRDVVRTRNPDELVELVDQAAASLRQARGARDASALNEPRGRLVTVFSTKGGAGRTVVATNLAVQLSKQSERPVALVDADIQFGDVAIMLGITPERTLIDAIRVVRRLDIQTMNNLMLRYKRTGLLVLPAPVEPAFADQVEATDVVRIVTVLQDFCSSVVVDTPAQFNDIVLALLERADDVVLVTGTDLPNVKSAKLAAQTMRALDISMDKVTTVLNRPRPREGIDADSVGEAVAETVGVTIRNDDAVLRAVNAAVPVVLHAPRSPAAHDLLTLAQRFVPVAIP